jgi:hypothetical protein
MHHEEVGLMPRNQYWFDILKSRVLIHHINSLKTKKHTAISTKYLIRFNIYSQF